MGISSAVDWWEEWQLRILVLGSLFVQWLLFLSAILRKLAIPTWFRSIIWLAYLGSDALAIYALANLFSRQRRQDCSSGQRNSILEVVWAPVLLMHLGGQDLITAYNIEDNELWTRHILTAVSQVTVAIYVFWKSWPGEDKRLLQATILFFVPAILKCIEKPWALKSASINSLVSSSGRALQSTTDREGGINSLENYVQKARVFVRCQAQEGDAVDLEADREPQAHGEVAALDLESDHHCQTSSTWRSHLNQIKENLRSLRDQRMEKRTRGVDDYNVHVEACKLFLDLASPYPDRIGILESFWGLDEKQAYALLQNRLFGAFDLLYTKRKMLSLWEERHMGNPSISGHLSGWIRFTAWFLPWAAIGLFHNSHREAYDNNDVKVTYALFCCTAVLEFFSISMMTESIAGKREFSAASLYEKAKRKATLLLRVKYFNPLYEKSKTIITQWKQAMPTRLLWLWAKQMDDPVNRDGLIYKTRFSTLLEWALDNSVLKNSFVGQYTLVGYFVRNERHTRKMSIVDFFNCKDFLDQHWSMKPCNSSFAVTKLVLKYAKKGWEDQIYDADSYWKFNSCRGLWTLQANKCEEGMGCSLRRPFDESVLLWHVATDFCFYYMDTSADHQCATAQCIQDVSGEGHRCAVWCEKSPHHERAVQCREMSNYMMYLLFVNPEMLMAGTRRNLFTTANAEVEKILKDDKPSLKKILRAKKPWLMDILKGENQWLKVILGSKASDPWMILKNIRKEILKAKKNWLEEIERGVVHRIISKVQPTECREVESTESSPDAEIYPSTQFIHDAWKLAKALLDIGDEKKMWDVIEGVWVEMLCFSASRCRGYQHAKSLGTGPELLTYVWFLLWHMGMETLPERLQRTELSSGGGNSGATLFTSQVHDMEYPTRFRRSRPDEAAGAGASTSQSQEILPTE